MLSIQDAISVINAGDKTTGRQILSKIIEDDPYNEDAWFWMSRAAENDKRRRECLEYVLAINPYNRAVQQELTDLRINSKEELTKETDTPKGAGAVSRSIPNSHSEIARNNVKITVSQARKASSRSDGVQIIGMVVGVLVGLTFSITIGFFFPFAPLILGLIIMGWFLFNKIFNNVVNPILGIIGAATALSLGFIIFALTGPVIPVIIWIITGVSIGMIAGGRLGEWLDILFEAIFGIDWWLKWQFWAMILFVILCIIFAWIYMR